MRRPSPSPSPSPFPPSARAGRAPEPRPRFVPPRIEDLGSLAALTQQDSFGGPIGILGPG